MEVYIFDYPEGWMILYYENGSKKHYYNCAEDDYDDSLALADELGCEIITYGFNNYDEFACLNIDIFNITESEESILSKYIKSIRLAVSRQEKG